MRTDVLVFALLIAFLWGISPIIHKQVLHSISMYTAMVISGFFYVMCTIIYMLYYRHEVKKDIHKINGKILVMLAFTSIVCAFLTNVIYFRIIKKYDSHVISALIYSSPVFTLIIAYFVLNEQVHPKGLLGVILIILGVICLAFNKSGEEAFLIK